MYIIVHGQMHHCGYTYGTLFYLLLYAYMCLIARQIRYGLSVVSNFYFYSDHFVFFNISGFFWDNISHFFEKWPLFIFCFKTGFGFLSAARFWSTLFHVSILKNDGEKTGTPSGKIVLPGPYGGQTTPNSTCDAPELPLSLERILVDT